MHTVEEVAVAPKEVLAVPAAHDVHMDDPVAVVYVPVVHAAHIFDVAPTTVDTDPATHAVHVADATALE